ncbi:MAG: PilN domain-containing protein [Syntrophomonadaceae bacterium]|nr:PilN domain-containing protein [Syntrophomonadaceae bacterium]
MFNPHLKFPNPMTRLIALVTSWSQAVRFKILKKQKPKQINLLTEAYQLHSPVNRLLVAGLSVGVIILLTSYFTLDMHRNLQEKELRLSELKASVERSASTADQFAELVALQQSVGEKERLISNWPKNTYPWSEALFDLKRAVTAECYLQEIKQEETEVYLKGNTPSYLELVKLLQSLDSLNLYAKLDVISSHWDTSQQQVWFELRCHYALDTPVDVREGK